MGDQPDGIDRPGDQGGDYLGKPPLPDFVPELRAQMDEYVAQFREWDNAPPTKDEQGNPLPRLNIENPDSAPQDPLLQVGYTLLALLPSGWRRVFLLATAAADDVRTSAHISMDDSDPPEVLELFFADLIRPLRLLRRSMYQADGLGAWYNATIQLYRDGTLHPKYAYQTPPFGCWGLREFELVRRDHEMYPRDPENLPRWHPARSI